VELQNSGACVGELQARLAVNNAIRNGTRLKLTSRMTWSQARAMCGIAWAVDLAICQEACGLEGSRYCVRHQYYYSGCAGCHVCSGFYEP